MQIEVFVRSLGHGLRQTGQDQEQTLQERGNGMLCHSLEGAVIFIFCSTLLLPGPSKLWGYAHIANPVKRQINKYEPTK